jgi:hypothetical protein
MEAAQIVSARKNGSSYAEIVRVSGKPEADVRAVIALHKMLELPAVIPPEEHSNK